jgi:hypothetical protein
MPLTMTTGLFKKMHSVYFQKLLLLLAGFLLPICNAGAQNDPAAEQQFFALMNDVRASAGLPLLKPDLHVKESASLHLSQFVNNRRISSLFAGERALQERLQSAGVLCGAASEIMAMAPDLNRPIEQLIGDDAKKTILDPRLTIADVAAVKSGNMWFVVADLIQPQQGLSIEEVEKLILTSVHDLRRAKGLRPLKGFWSKRLRAAAGEMAKKDSLNVEIPDAPDASFMGSDRPYARAFAYTSFNPKELPQSIVAMPDDPKINTIAVGACFAKSKTYPNGMYWIVIQLYAAASPSKTKSN